MRYKREANKLQDSTVTVRIACKECSSKADGCHIMCPQAKVIETNAGKLVTNELLNKGRRARIHSDIDVTFHKFMHLVAEKEI